MRRLIATFLLLTPSSAFAWGPKAHRIIADVAERQLGQSSVALKRTLDILGVKHLADVASLPDDWVKKPGLTHTAAWHLVNIPFDQDSFDSQRDCNGSQCIVSAINQFLAIM